ncbi:MAG: DNA topoisomerase IB [Chlorogloeopsis fritschii C42_A2020_084]|jgi:DNA topoisomerase I|uniref:DNA topoisomerase IB n=1 Tax=Chlorogloeopsis fritschii TaxID=1124 RepID=UPI001A059101|nr:DNA topoisomerase IB [Chlorogloeopsis fritschii]MBF2006741.1 DNA topoisomerase IB [Chlorogloeopsis fritschii C42_A2020_084]
MQLKLQKEIIKEVKAALVIDPIESAELVGLHYVSDTTPGIWRQRVGEEFCYFDANGKKICDETELTRIKALVIPPAWSEVWICPHSQGHLQATGRDAKGRKQYRYHSHWQKVRSQTKFTRMIAFGQALPKIRQHVQADLALGGLPKEKVLATVVKLMEITKIRVGNEEYAQTNKSFGLTTMRDRHVNISGSKLRFKFRGKSGVEHDIDVSDRRLAKIVKSCQDIPGQELFQYLDDDGHRQAIGSGDVNDYLREITGLDFTAKDFRTWFGTVLAAQELYDLGQFTSQTAAKKNITQAIKNVAQELGNRPATCRKYYVHPAVLEAYTDGSLLATIEKELENKQNVPKLELRPEERAVCKILEHYLLQVNK